MVSPKSCEIDQSESMIHTGWLSREEAVRPGSLRQKEWDLHLGLLALLCWEDD